MKEQLRAIAHISQTWAPGEGLGLPQSAPPTFRGEPHWAADGVSKVSSSFGHLSSFLFFPLFFSLSLCLSISAPQVCSLSLAISRCVSSSLRRYVCPSLSWCLNLFDSLPLCLFFFLSLWPLASLFLSSCLFFPFFSRFVSVMVRLSVALFVSLCLSLSLSLCLSFHLSIFLSFAFILRPQGASQEHPEANHVRIERKVQIGCRFGHRRRSGPRRGERGPR